MTSASTKQRKRSSKSRNTNVVHTHSGTGCPKKISPVEGKSKLKLKEEQSNDKTQLHSSKHKWFMSFVVYLGIGASLIYWRAFVQIPEVSTNPEATILSADSSDIEKSSNFSGAGYQKQALADNSPPHVNATENRKLTSNFTESVSEMFPDFQMNILREFSPTPVLSQTGEVMKKWKEIKPRNNKSSTNVRIFIMDDFLSSRECDGLKRAHENHVKMHSEFNPLVCFSDEGTMQLYARQARVKWANRITSMDFTTGTLCLNETFSAELEGKLPWSQSTSFYPGESRFSALFEQKVQKYAGFDIRNGGKFQITSYGQEVGYKLHTDCTEGNTDLRDRFATILVYLQDVEGGETEFTELGVKIRPKKGRALIWNNMNSQGNCDLTSYHRAASVTRGKKYILQRWYYYQNFPMLGKRSEPPVLPVRYELTPRITCDRYDSGSCRWYDEWNYDHLTNYSKGYARV